MWRGFPRFRQQVLFRPEAFLISFLLTAFASTASAQARGSFSGGFHAGFHNSAGFAGNHAGYGRYPAFWGDPYFYADYPYQSLAYPAPAPPVVVVQQTAAAPADPQRLPESVLIEWQGNRYVRSTGEHGSNLAQDYSELGSNAGMNPPAAQAADSDLPPAILIYRDGHREEVADYVIAGGHLYARGDYYRDGYWSKNIQLASLDIPATLKANERTGVRFVLPSAPNEVVTRP